MDKVPQRQAKNGNLNSRGLCNQDSAFLWSAQGAASCSQEVLESTKAGVPVPLHGGGSAVLCACLQADGWLGVICSQRS